MTRQGQERAGDSTGARGRPVRGEAIITTLGVKTKGQGRKQDTGPGRTHRCATGT